MKIYRVRLLITLHFKDQLRVPWKVAQLVKRMLCKHEDLRGVPNTHLKSKAWCPVPRSLLLEIRR